MYKEAISKYNAALECGEFRPKAVLFDMDGVIYDSMKNHAVSWHESMKAIGLDMDYADAYRYEGMRGVETIKLLAREQWHKELSDEQAAEYYAQKSAYYNSCPTAQKMEGITTLMQKIKAMGMQIAVVTGSGQHSLLDKLATDLDGLVMRDKIVSSRDVTHGKPNPEPYLKGLEKVDARPWEAIVVENAPLGVRAGVAAGIFTIGVNTGPLPDSALLSEGASLVFPRMTTLADEWEQLFR